MVTANVLEENKLLWKIVDASFDGIFLTDASGLILYFNEAYLKISGLDKERIQGRKIEDLITSGEIPDACSHEVISTGQSVTKIIDYYHGTSALVTSVPIKNDSGQLVRVLSNVRDITELTKMREQLKNSKDLAEQYRLRLWQADQASRDNKMIVFSPAMENILKLAARVANVSSPVLIQGESGVGKDMLARFIHDSGAYAAHKPFVQINCGAIPETLLESELFGYEAGAFTGAARKGKVGLIELANHGTLFLDEIGEMPPPLQVKLLDVLHTNKIYRLGGTKTIDVSIRVIAATNANLDKLLDEGKFRRDLYYRLNVIPIRLPPLRERKEDMIPFIFYFVDQYNRRYNLTKQISPQVVNMLTCYSWPGNVRELRNVVESMVVTFEGDVISEKAVPPHIAQAAGKTLFIETPDYFDSFELRHIIAEVEGAVIQKALLIFGSLREAAANLGIDLSTLVRKKRKYKL